MKIQYYLIPTPVNSSSLPVSKTVRGSSDSFVIVKGGSGENPSTFCSETKDSEGGGSAFSITENDEDPEKEIKF